jgi:hypothetical protein
VKVRTWIRSCYETPDLNLVFPTETYVPVAQRFKYFSKVIINFVDDMVFKFESRTNKVKLGVLKAFLKACRVQIQIRFRSASKVIDQVRYKKKIPVHKSREKNETN